MIEIVNYRKVNKGSVLGNFDVKVKKWGGFIIAGMTHFNKNSHEWVSFPSRAYEKDGATKYAPHCKFDDPALQKAFLDKCLAAVKAMAPAPDVQEEYNPGEVPF